MNINLDIVILALTVVGALYTVMGRSLLKATMGLAVTSALLSILMFRLGAEFASIFELSVCAGLITAIFVSTISMTKPLTNKEIVEASKDRTKRYIWLPVILLVVGAALVFAKFVQDFSVVSGTQGTYEVREVLWNFRRLDILGQVIILIAGALGIVILFQAEKEVK